MSVRTCDFKGCFRRHRAGGYCEMHYRQLYRRGVRVSRNQGREPRVSSLPLQGRMTRHEYARLWAARFGVTMDGGYHAADRLMKRATITVTAADRWCVALGLHLAMVYPSLYEEAA